MKRYLILKRIQFCVERCVFRQEILSLSHSIAKKQIRPFGHFAGCTCISPSTLTISPTFKGGLRSRPLGHMRFLFELALHPCNCVWVTFSFTWAKCRKTYKIKGWLPSRLRRFAAVADIVEPLTPSNAELNFLQNAVLIFALASHEVFFPRSTVFSWHPVLTINFQSPPCCYFVAVASQA